jgi:phosphatidylglycerol:prolipoprotein diacylglycerol transferase
MIGYVEFPTWLRPEIIPGFPIRWYGLMYLVAFACTYWLFLHLAVNRGELHSDRDTVLSLFFWGIVGVLLGGRLFSVLIYDPTGFYARNPLQIVFPFQRVDGALRFIGLQGMSYHGGLVGAITAVMVYCRVKRLPVLHVADLLAASAPLGYTFGRLGNFINGELYGRITSSPIGMVFPHAPEYPTSAPWVRELADEAGLAIADGAALVNLPRYPSQLFEAFFEGVFLWALLWFVFRRWRLFPGFLATMYLIGYGVARFAVEYLREPDEGLGFPLSFVPVANPAQFSLWNFTTGQLLSAAMVVCGMAMLMILASHPSPGQRRPGRQRSGSEAERGSARRAMLRRMRKKLR